MNRILSVFCLCMLSTYAWSQDSTPQDSRIKLIGIEAGIDFLGGAPEHEYIRAETSYYGEAEKNLESLSHKRYTGIKAEIRSRNNKFGLSAGLRYTYIKSSVGKASYYSTTSDFFYFMTRQTDNSIEYLKVEEINESSHYIGIPLKVNWYPFPEHFFTFYFNAGLEFNYRVSTKTNVVFTNSEMNPFSDAVTDRLEQPRNVTSIIGTSVGVKIGQSKKVICTIEAGPSGFLSNRTSSIVDLKGGFGAQLNFKFVL
jgi:hypothetical protein